MPVNQGGSALKGIYLGDQLLTGGSAQEVIQAAIDAPNPSDLTTLILSPDTILSNSTAMVSISNDETSLDTLVNNALFNQVVQNYPEIRTIFDNSPYKENYLPGPITLAKGDAAKGYYGTVNSSEFGTYLDKTEKGQTIDGTNLASYLGITMGTAINTTITWQKFAWQNDIWYIAMQPIRHSISWNALNAAGAALGTATINMTRGTFNVLLLTGEADQAWDSLLRGLLSGGWCGTSYTSSPLGFMKTGDGGMQWCQELVFDSYRRIRYGVGGADESHADPNSSLAYYGWRPALRFTL